MNMDLGHTRLIIAECQSRGILRNQVAYILATARWETAHTMRPIKERGSQSYLEGKRYYPWIGRGFVQLTWERNYKRAGEEIGRDLTSEPDRAMDPAIAAEVLIVGMMEGWFTGKSLGDYVTLQESDFRNARRIVNGMDKADTIAAIARDYDKALKSEGYGVEPEKKGADKMAKVPTGPLARTSRQVLLGVAGFFVAQIGWLSIDQANGVIAIDYTAFAENIGPLIGAAATGGGSVWWWRVAKRLGGAL